MSRGNRDQASQCPSEGPRLLPTAAICLEGQDKADQEQETFQDYEQGTAGVRRAPLVEARSKHPEEAKQQAEPTRQGLRGRSSHGPSGCARGRSRVRRRTSAPRRDRRRAGFGRRRGAVARAGTQKRAAPRASGRRGRQCALSSARSLRPSANPPLFPCLTEYTLCEIEPLLCFCLLLLEVLETTFKCLEPRSDVGRW